MSYEVRQLASAEFPPLLAEINDPPTQLFAAGDVSLLVRDIRFLAVVGSRKYTTYGKQACESLIAGLRGAPVCIVSGLAMGIDAIAHRAALAAGLTTIAIPGSGLGERVLYPRSNRTLADDIIAGGGALVSEYENDFKACTWSFPQRNRIMAGMSHATLVIEATEKSGTLITSRLASDYNRDVLTVPGSIFSAHTSGPNMLLRLGATPIRNSDDILEALGIADHKRESADHLALTESEQAVIALLAEPRTKDELIRALDLPTHEAQILLTKMELKKIIVERTGKIQVVYH